jgi:hypothetical protein
MDEIGGLLNLKKHTVGEQKVSIVGPGDIEGHKGLDGRYYLLDYARLFPSQALPSYVYYISLSFCATLALWRD